MKKGLVKKVTLSILAAFVGMGAGYSNAVWANSIIIDGAKDIIRDDNPFDSTELEKYYYLKNNNGDIIGVRNDVYGAYLDDIFISQQLQNTVISVMCKKY